MSIAYALGRGTPLLSQWPDNDSFQCLRFLSNFSSSWVFFSSLAASDFIHKNAITWLCYASLWAHALVCVWVSVFVREPYVNCECQWPSRRKFFHQHLSMPSVLCICWWSHYYMNTTLFAYYGNVEEKWRKSAIAWNLLIERVCLCLIAHVLDDSRGDYSSIYSPGTCINIRMISNGRLCF